MAELWTRSPIMQGNTEQHQITLISQLCGTIDTTVWPNVNKLDLFSKINLPQGLKRRVTQRMQLYIKDQYGLDLLDRLLTINPNTRIDSNEALDHDFFWTEPLPAPIKLDKHLKNMYELTSRPRSTQVRTMQQQPLVSQQCFDRVY